MRLARPIFSGSRTHVINLAAEDEVLDLLVNCVIELVAVVSEKLDAVIFVGVMRRAQHNSGIGTQRTGDVSDARRRQRSDDQDIDAE